MFLFEGGSSNGNFSLNGASGPATSLLDAGFVYVGENFRNYVGFDMDMTSDINGDGFADITFGAQRGCCWGGSSLSIWYGPVSFSGSVYTAADADAWIELSGNDGWLFPEPAGDVNDDGYDDLWVGNRYNTYLFHGTPN